MDVLAGFVCGDAEDDEALGGVLLVELFKPGHFKLAGCAPGGPKVDEDGLAFEGGEGDLFAVEIDEREGRGLPCPASWGRRGSRRHRPCRRPRG